MVSFCSVSRRNFIKTLASGTVVTLSITGLPIKLLSSADAREKSVLHDPDWADVPGVAKMRIDGLAKILGHKIYARDFHSSDMEGWPLKNERYLFALRADKVDNVVNGYDLSVLPPELNPMRVVDHDVVSNDNMELAGGMVKPFFVEMGKTPDHYGQPVAILIFENFNIYRKAKNILQFNNRVVQYGETGKRPASVSYSPASGYVRNDELQFNYVDNASDYYERYDEVSSKTASGHNENNWNVFERHFKSQSMDPVFMEPESGLSWFDRDNGILHLAVGTQSPSGDVSKIADMFGNDECVFDLKSIKLTACHLGGGFGGRDDSYFPKYLSLCAPYADGPVRWIPDRYEQFQFGLKRHETEFYEQILIDNDGIIRMLKSDFVMNGGGRQNLSPYIAQLAAMCSNNSYEIKNAVSNYKAIDTKDLVGGAQRGFGAPQAFIAMETLLDEAAEKLKISPFDIRRKNLLKNGSKTITGAPVMQDLQLSEILDELEKQPLWQERFVRQQEYGNKGLRYGVGLALTSRPFGTEGDGMFGAIEIKQDGNIEVRTPYVEMGSGASTSLSLAPSKFLGKNAANIKMGELACFDALGLTTSYYENPNIFVRALNKFGIMDDEENRKFVSFGSGSSSACLSAFHQYHVIEQAGLTLLIQTILPAASKIWGTVANHQEVKWQNGSLILDGYKDIGWDELITTIFESKLPTATIVHASHMTKFVTADFEFSASKVRLPLDYIAVGSSLEEVVPLERHDIVYPPDECRRYGRSLFAPCAALVSILIDPDDSSVRIEDCVSVLSAGKQLCPELISGQSQGGVAMAIGYTLMEECPNTDDGPGNGKWNLDQYTIPGQSDMPRSQKLIILEPPKGEETARGIAEAVMCPIPPAILNALSMATNGHRFSKLPVTVMDISEVLS